jgi:hypothetical protein
METETELEQAQHEDRWRTEQEREVNARHEAMLEESQRAHFLDENLCR